LHQPDPSHAKARRCGPKFAYTSSLAAHAGLGDAVDTVARHEARQAAGVVFVGVRQYDQVEVPIPQRDALVKASHQEVRIGAAVDQDAVASGGLQQDGIALADVQHVYL
jgi:hypothetical protein